MVRWSSVPRVRIGHFGLGRCRTKRSRWEYHRVLCMLAANTGLTHYYLDYDSAEYDSDVYEPEDLGSCGQSVDTAPHMHDGE